MEDPPISSLPESNPTQTAPQNPFTMPDMGLFVTNPRALPDHHKANNPFMEPPKKTRDGRRPRVKSNIMASLLHHRPGSVPGGSGPAHAEEVATTQRIVPVLRINPDGRKPRVKSNILNKNNNKKKKNKNDRKKGSRHKGSNRSRAGFARSLDLDDDSENEINESFDVSYDADEDYIEPEVRPDGRKPRIKSNIKVKESIHGNQSANKKKKSSFRHSKKVARPATTTPASNSNDDLIDDTDNAITTFRPIISLEDLMSTNETFPAPPPEVSVPLPNFDKSIIDTSDRDKETKTSDERRRAQVRDRFAEAVFQPTPRGFLQSKEEPAFSDFPKRQVLDRAGWERVRQSVQSATEIVRVSSKDQSLFDSDYNYEDYYYS